VRDVALIVGLEPSLSGVGYFAASDGKQLLLSADAQTLAEMQAGTYSAWNCLNQTYGLSSTRFGATYVLLRLKGNYNLERLSSYYAALPGIKGAGPDSLIGGGSTICVVRESAAWHYVFDIASGDCPAGCINHELHHFTVTSSGTVAALGVPSDADKAVYASREACR